MAKKQRVSVVGTVLTVEYPTINKKFTVDFSTYPKAVQPYALAHGYKQKFGDAESGKSASEKYAEVQLIHKSLMAGEWERTGTRDLTPLICEAIARIKKVPVQKLVDYAAKNEKQHDEILEQGAKQVVKAEIAKIRAERAAKLAEDSEEEIEIDLK